MLEDADWIYLTKHRDSWKAPASTISNLSFPQKERKSQLASRLLAS